MIRIKVKFFAHFREVFGAREKEMALERGSALSILLSQLTETSEQRREIFQGGRAQAAGGGDGQRLGHKRA